MSSEFIAVDKYDSGDISLTLRPRKIIVGILQNKQVVKEYHTKSVDVNIPTNAHAISSMPPVVYLKQWAPLKVLHMKSPGYDNVSINPGNI